MLLLLASYVGRCLNRHPTLTVIELKQKQEKLSQMSESESSYTDTDSMPEEEPIMWLFDPTTGKELDPNSAQYQVLCRFLYNDNNHPGSSNQEDLHQGQHLPGKRLRRSAAGHVPKNLHQRQNEIAPSDTQHQGQENDSLR